jgi:DNA-directed RNA polymerase subunit RPC12/RpoP
MYAVVGCSECSALWVLEGDPETSECPRCGSRRPREKRRVFHRCEDADEAREARGRLLAERQGEAEAFESVASFEDLEGAIDAAGPDDETYLAGSGLDPAAVEAAGERATAGRKGQSREETVRAALRELDAPDAAAVAAYCRDHGLDRGDAEAILEKLRRAGEVTRRDGGYRLL